MQILTYLAAFYPAATGIPASFGEEINLVFSNTLAALKERGLIDYETNTTTALPAAIAITSVGMAFLNCDTAGLDTRHLDDPS
ncbi:hypothetical protein RA27_00840 [Ruegeria sp. ANG-R]|nr:hypothetical protein RA27_00840 [Ruegeria sp. ANG-R]